MEAFQRLNHLKRQVIMVVVISSAQYIYMFTVSQNMQFYSISVMSQMTTICWVEATGRKLLHLKPLTCHMGQKDPYLTMPPKLKNLITKLT